MSNFLSYQMFGQPLTTNHNHEDFLPDGTCDPEAGSNPLLPVNKHTKASGWGTTLSKTHDMPKKSRVAFDCVYFQRSCNLSNIERINLLQEPVAATLLDPRNMPDLNCIPLSHWQHDQALALLRSMVLAVIGEVKNSDASTDVNDSIEDVNDFSVTASAAAAVNSLDLSGAEIADREIKKWQIRIVRGSFPRTRIFSTRGIAVLCIFSLDWVSWRGVYLLFLQLQQLPSACFPWRVT